MKKKRYFATLPNHCLNHHWNLILPDNRNGPSNDSLNIMFNFIIFVVIRVCILRHGWYVYEFHNRIGCWVSGYVQCTQNQLSSISYRKAHWIHGQRKKQRTLKTTNIDTQWFDGTTAKEMIKNKRLEKQFLAFILKHWEFTLRWKVYKHKHRTQNTEHVTTIWNLKCWMPARKTLDVFYYVFFNLRSSVVAFFVLDKEYRNSDRV